MRKSIGILLIISFMIFTLTSCTQGTERPKGSEKITVYASIYPIYDFTKKIGRDHIHVELLVPPGAEPHTWEPSAKTMAHIERSKLLLYNGLDMDPWAEKLASSLKSTHVVTLAVGERKDIDYIKAGQEEDHAQEEHHHGIYDPHIWLDPNIAQKMAQSIRDALIGVDQANKAIYEENHREFNNQLERLDEEYQELLAQSPKKEFVVAHAAFDYLARRYQLTQVPIAGIAPQAEPSSTKLAEITSLIQEKEISTIFSENLTSPKLAKVLAQETGAKVEVLHSLDGLTQEEMDSGKEYLSLMRENLEKIAKALGAKE